MTEPTDAKRAAAEALRNVHRTTRLPRALRRLTGEAVRVELTGRLITERQLHHGKYADRS